MKYEEVSNLREILAHYDIGELVDYQRDRRGTVNTSFMIETDHQGERQKYFLRRYKQGIEREEIEFEHDLIHHLLKHGFDRIARVIQTRTGDSYVEIGDHDGGLIYYALFEFLQGEDRYTWVNPKCDEIESAASLLAEYHIAVWDLIPKGRRAEPKILDLLPIIDRDIDFFLERSKHTLFDAYLLDQRDFIHKTISRLHQALNQIECQEIVQLVIHSDYHPGNLKFQGAQATALFDFDWSKMDARCFDVGLAIWYFFVEWEAERDGSLRLDDIDWFVETYQNSFQGKSGVYPMSVVELGCLVTMIEAASLYVLNWAIQDYYSKEVDPAEYLHDLQHCVNALKWLADTENRRKLERLFLSQKVDFTGK